MKDDLVKPFYVEVTRISYTHKIIGVAARNQEEANKKALEEAPNQHFSGDSSTVEYEIN